MDGRPGLRPDAGGPHLACPPVKKPALSTDDLLKKSPDSEVQESYAPQTFKRLGLNAAVSRTVFCE